MFKYKFFQFFNKENEVMTIQFENSKFLIGEFFSESSIINLCNSLNNKIEEKKKNYNMIDWTFFPFNINFDVNNDIQYIKEIFSDLKVIIIPNFKSILGYILIYKLIIENEDVFQINKEILNKIMIYSSEPIIQFARCYLNEFYSTFNSLLINYTIKGGDINKNLFLNRKLNIINNNDIDNFLNHIISINYKEKINYLVPLSSNLNSLLNSQETSSLIEKYISFELCSNGYELGSSNVLFHYYDKTIYIMTKSSIIDDRYPLIFDSQSPKCCDFILIFPNAINKNNYGSSNYEDNFKRLMETLIKSNTYENADFKCTHYYPYTLIITYPFFMLDFCDVFRFKLKPAKTIYFSKTVKSLFKYCNVSLGFLNNKLVNKIYEFKFPFSIDDLEKEKNLIVFNDVIEFQNQLINLVNNNIRDDSKINNASLNHLYNFGISQNTYVSKKNKKVTKDETESNYESKIEFVKNLIDKICPFYFISHYFSIYNENNKDLIDFFLNNYDNKYDKIIIVSNNADYNENIFSEMKNKLNLNGAIFENFVLDYRLDNEKFKNLIKEINPKIQLSNEIDKEYKEITIIKNNEYLDKNLEYNNCYLLSNNNKGILNQLSNKTEFNLKLSKEQLRYNISLDKQNSISLINNPENKIKKGKKKKENDNKDENIMNNEGEHEEVYEEYTPESIEESEDILNKYLEMNDMEITEYLKDENSIEITIYNKIKKTYTEIKINNYYKENIDNTEKDNKKGKGRKNKSSKKSKSKEKGSNQMEIEETKDDKQDLKEIDSFPFIDISSEDTDDSLFLNTLFNSIFI